MIVSVYYRLDAIGFLSIPEFSDPVNGDSNAGFYDQIQALKWVNKNIAAFGGNPRAVTINGQSAGGASVELHMVANTEHLFRGVIAQSVYRTPLATPEQRMVSITLFNSVRIFDNFVASIPTIRLEGRLWNGLCHCSTGLLAFC